MLVDRNLSKVDPHYLVCLKSYWAGDYSKCDEQIRSALASSQDPSLDLLLYRMWIQIASITSEVSTLEALKNSLVELAMNAGGESHIYFSLIGLIHFEMDEIDAAHLFFNNLQSRPANLYFRELEFCLKYLSFEVSFEWIKEYESLDYISLENLVLKLSSNRSYDLAFNIVNDLGNLYRHSKIFDKLRLLLIEELGNVNDQIEVITHLEKAFPNNMTYKIKLAQALLSDGQYREVREILNDLCRSSFSENAYVNAMMGHCYLELFKRQPLDEYHMHALQFIEKSILLSEQEGTSPRYSYLLKTRLMQMGQHKIKSEPKSLWLSLLGPNAFAELRSADYSQLEYLRRPLGAMAKEGDLCLMMCEDRISRDGRKVWRLGAIYQVAGDVEWDPINRHQNLLKLYYKPEMAVPIDVNQDNRKSGGIHNPSDPRRYNVYEIDVTALENICDQVCEELGSSDPISLALNELRVAS